MSNRSRISEAILITFLFVVFCSLPEKYVMAVEKVDAYTIVLEGEKLSSEEAVKLEEKLKNEPDDLSARTILIGYYWLKSYESKEAKKERQKHIMWIIQNYPESEIAGAPYAELDAALDREAYYEAKKLWLEQVEAHKENTKIIGNAAKFVLIYDTDMAENLLIQAKALEPNNPEWPERLGHLYSLAMIRESTELKKESGVKSLEQLEEALHLTAEDEKRFYMLSDLAKSAFEAGELNKASEYASELLQKAPQYKDNWNYGNAIHKGNLILGRIALASGKLEEVKDYLLEAGKISGSPQLNSSGPNMTLAKELLENGESEVVIRYLQECGNFWEAGKDQLKNWISIVEKRGMPDFGPNLDF